MIDDQSQQKFVSIKDDKKNLKGWEKQLEIPFESLGNVMSKPPEVCIYRMTKKPQEATRTFYSHWQSLQNHIFVF